jgi:hypothetical protein
MHHITTVAMVVLSVRWGAAPLLSPCRDGMLLLLLLLPVDICEL